MEAKLVIIAAGIPGWRMRRMRRIMIMRMLIIMMVNEDDDDDDDSRIYWGNLLWISQCSYRVSVS